jgi:hypothetical protein
MLKTFLEINQFSTSQGYELQYTIKKIFKFSEGFIFSRTLLEAPTIPLSAYTPINFGGPNIKHPCL